MARDARTPFTPVFAAGFGRRDLLKSGAALVATLAAPGAAAAVAPPPKLSGPIAGGKNGHAFGAAGFDLSKHGYVEEEFFFEGTATTYRLVGERSADGRWQAVASGSVPYKSRMLVRRPQDAARFNGTVIVLWNNVTAGYDLITAQSPEILEGGYALACVSAQRVGVHGFAAPPQMGLTAWDPERYGSLSVPSDDASFDIYSQAARLVGRDRPKRGPNGAGDPLGGLAVKQVLSRGGSQSAGRLATYINAVHPLARAFDGFLLDVYFGNGTPLETPKDAAPPGDISRRTGTTVMPAGSHILRSDLTVPVMVVNTETEATPCYTARQPDTDLYRFWEIAGTAHASTSAIAYTTDILAREFKMALPPADPGSSQNVVDSQPVGDAALRHFQRWLQDGTPPPVAPRIEFAGSPASIQRDRFGIAKGGIRLPQVEVPTATHSGVNDGAGAAFLIGKSVPFEPQKLRELYPDHATYVRKFEAAAQAAVTSGFLLPRDADALIADAKKAAVPA